MTEASQPNEVPPVSDSTDRAHQLKELQVRWAEALFDIWIERLAKEHSVADKDGSTPSPEQAHGVHASTWLRAFLDNR